MVHKICMEITIWPANIYQEHISMLYVAGIMVGLYDLFEMKTISYMHCNIYGHMDCTNMSLLGETNIPIEDEYGPKGAEHFFVLDYFPKVGFSKVSFAESFYGIYFINSWRPSDAYMCHQTRPSLVQIMACCLVGAKPLSEPMLGYCLFKP